MTANSNIVFHHAARYPYLWVPTTEEERFIRDNRAQVGDDVDFYQWDIVSGWQKLQREGSAWIWVSCGIENSMQRPSGAPPAQPNPADALKQIFDGKTSCFDGEAVFFMKDYHRYFKDITIVRRALSIKDHLKSTGRTLVHLAPSTTDIPMEMRNDVSVVDFEYPNPGALRKILEICCEDNECELPLFADDIVDAMRGFTAEAAENALSYCLAKNGNFNVRTILDMKAAYLKAGGVLSYGNFRETLADLHGLEYMKRFVLGTINNPRARGILIYGVPGTGKSHFAKAVGNAVNRAVLIAKFSAIRSRYQGEAEQRTAEMFKTVDAFGRPIVFVDELDKVIAGTGSADADAGVGQRILAEFLTYMQDRGPGGPYWICTLNSIDDVLHLSGGALLRRFDALFFVDMPTPAEAKGIAKIWNTIEGVEIPMDWNFDGCTGADIARLATHMAMLETGPEEASKFLIPYGQANKAELEEIRNKAKGTCIWASDAHKQIAPVKKRKVARAVNPDEMGHPTIISAN